MKIGENERIKIDLSHSEVMPEMSCYTVDCGMSKSTKDGCVFDFGTAIFNLHATKDVP